MSKAEEAEYRDIRRKKLFCLLTEKPKRGMIFKSIIHYNCNFCGKQFEDKDPRKFCSNICSGKWHAIKNGSIEKLKNINKGKPAWNKGLPNSTAAENGKKNAAKQSATVTGRRILVKEDGTRTWIYPNKNMDNTQASN